MVLSRSLASLSSSYGNDDTIHLKLSSGSMEILPIT